MRQQKHIDLSAARAFELIDLAMTTFADQYAGENSDLATALIAEEAEAFAAGADEDFAVVVAVGVVGAAA